MELLDGVLSNAIFQMIMFVGAFALNRYADRIKASPNIQVSLAVVGVLFVSIFVATKTPLGVQVAYIVATAVAGIWLAVASYRDRLKAKDRGLVVVSAPTPVAAVPGNAPEHDVNRLREVADLVKSAASAAHYYLLVDLASQQTLLTERDLGRDDVCKRFAICARKLMVSHMTANNQAAFERFGDSLAGTGPVTRERFENAIDSVSHLFERYQSMLEWIIELGTAEFGSVDDLARDPGYKNLHKRDRECAEELRKIRKRSDFGRLAWRLEKHPELPQPVP